MTGPSVYQFVRNRAGRSWLILVAATLIAFVFGADHGSQAGVVIVVLGIAAVKVRLIGLDFMELRHAPLSLRAIFEGYCLVLWSGLSVLYLWL